MADEMATNTLSASVGIFQCMASRSAFGKYVIQSLRSKWTASTSGHQNKYSKGQQPRTFSLKLSKF